MKKQTESAESRQAALAQVRIRLEAAAAAGVVEKGQFGGKMEPRPAKAVSSGPMTAADEISKNRE